MDVAVVGSGILGAAAAWFLATGGARVTVYEAAPGPGGLATPASFAWINASWGNSPAYRALRVAAMADWRDLGAQVPGAAPDWCGGLLWDLPEPDLRAFATEGAAQGYPLIPVDAQGARALEPALADPPAYALHAPHEGMIEPAAAARALIVAAGARVMTGASVTLDQAGGRVVLRGPDGPLPADAAVLAAGIATPGLLAGLGLHLPMTRPQGMLAWTQPAPRLLRGLVMTPAMHLRQTPAGQIVIGADFAGGGAAGVEAAEALVASARAALTGANGLVLDRITLANRPTPGDGFPVVGPVGPAGLHVILTHSGVTLAPRLGRAVAAAVLHGRDEPLLAPFRPARFGL
jgi:glycine/D-amino acid oxidase-like deaminating enzyme